MVEFMMENILMEEKKGLELIVGLINENIKEIGKMDYKMELEH